MPTATNDDIIAVMSELGVSYTAFGFPDETAYYDYLVERWNRVDRLIDQRIGAANHDEVAFPEQFDGHVFWTVAEAVRRKRINILVEQDGGSGGYTIGRFSVDSNAPTSREHAALYSLYKQLADEIFQIDAAGQLGGAIFVADRRGTHPWTTRADRPMTY